MPIKTTGAAEKSPAKARKPSQTAHLKKAWPAFLEWKRAHPATLTLPMPGIENTNAAYSGHWRSRKAATDEFFLECATLEAAGLLPRPPALPPERATVHVTMYVQRIHDHDSAVSRLKRALDFLVRQGWLKDDKPANCNLLMPMQVKAAGTPPRVEFEIVPDLWAERTAQLKAAGPLSLPLSPPGLVPIETPRVEWEGEEKEN